LPAIQKLGEKINHRLGAFILPINLFGSTPRVGIDFGAKSMLLRTPSIGAADIYVWSVSDLDLGSMIYPSTGVIHGLTRLNTKQVAYELV
jgi:hypothetical protein